MFAVPKSAVALLSLAFAHLGAVACGPEAATGAILSERVAGKFEYTAKLCGSEDAAPVEAKPHYAQQLSLYDSKPGARIAYAPTYAPRVNARPFAVYATPSRSIGAGASSLASVPEYTLPPQSVVRSRPIGSDAASRAIEMSPQVSEVARAYRIDPLLLHAIAYVESRHNPKAVSHAGAIGMMQVMPATARRFGVDAPHSQLRDPKTSLEVSSAYLKFLQDRFDNDLTLVVAAYNAGEGAVEKHGRRVPPYKETQAYVRDVLAHYRMLTDVRTRSRSAALAQSN